MIALTIAFALILVLGAISSFVMSAFYATKGFIFQRKQKDFCEIASLYSKSTYCCYIFVALLFTILFLYCQ